MTVLMTRGMSTFSGNVHGGLLLEYLDQVACTCAMRYVVRADHRHAVSVDDLERTSGATWVLEALLGVPVTSRGVPTMLRLQAKLSSARV
jgi:hypothetical protein